MAYKMFTTGLVLALAGMCLCQQQQQQSASGSQYQQQSAVSQASFQIGSAATQQTKLEDIERDSLTAADYGQKTQQQPTGKSSSSAAAAASAQQQAPLQPQAYQTVPPSPQQYFVQPYPAQQQQFYVQPYQAQPYQAAFDYAGVQYMFINPSTNQVYQPYYVPAMPQPSAVPQYVTKQSSPAAAKAQAQQEYKQQQYAAAPAQAQQEYKQQQYAAAPAQAQQEYKQQQYTFVPSQATQQQQQFVYSAPAYTYAQQPAAAAAAPAGSLDFSYVTRHPAAATQYKAAASPAVQPQQQYQYQVPQQQVQYQQQQPQYYYTVPATAAAGQVAAEQQPRVQQSVKSQYSSGVKSTTPSPVKESFAYKFESPAAQQPQGAAYSTLRFSA